MRKVFSLLLAAVFMAMVPLTALASSTVWDDNIPVESMSASQFNTYAVKADGTLWGTGLNTNGQLGIGNTANKGKMTKLMEGVKAVSAGGAHTLILKNDNTLWAVGANSQGQLGDGTKEMRTTPVKIMDDVKIGLAGYSHSLAIKTDNTLWAWGFNEKSQLGASVKTDENKPVKIMDGVAEAAAGTYFTFVIKEDGSVWKVGAAEENIAAQAVQISDGQEHASFVDNGNGGWSWGLNISGQLGTGNNQDSLSAVKVMDDVSKIAAGYSHTLFLKTDNTLWACGDNSYGQLGDGTKVSKTTPVMIMDGVSDIYSRAFHSAAIKMDGSIWAWGNNADSQYGMGSAQSEAPVQIFAAISSMPSFWAVTEVEQAISLGLVTSKAASDYQGNINREEFAELVVTLYEKLSGQTIIPVANPFADTDNNDIVKAFTAGIVLGTSANEFSPGDLITRQEIATMFVRALTSLYPDKAVETSELSFEDADQIEGWARDGILYCVGAGLLKGTEVNTVEPLGNCTREEAILVTLRSFNSFK